jgi:predicted nucleotidyltransferase
MAMTINEIKEIVSEVAKKYDVERVYLFGSYARGEQCENSDIDLHVYTEKSMGFSYFALYADLEQRLGNKIDLLTGDLKENPKARFKSTVISNILSEEVLIYERP